MFKELIQWSTNEFSGLPWRKKRTLYRTLVSEIMLQQTTVSTVINHFERFLKEYPDIKSLAASTEEQIVMSWKGLGYYRRARNLRKAAIDIHKNHGGRIPTSYELLLEINGIGPYTASALVAIGKNDPALAVDANLERVLSRIFGIEMKKGPKLQKEIQRRFAGGEISIDFGRFEPRHLNEALMDLGRIYCQSRRIDCDLCPVRPDCFGFKTGRALSIPLIEEVKKEVHDLELLRVVVMRGRKVLSYRKHEKEWLSGQYELPTFILSTSDHALKQYPKLGKKLTEINVKSLKAFKTAITKYRITNRILSLTEAEFKKLTSEKSGNYSFVSTNPIKTNHATSTLKVFKKLDV